MKRATALSIPLINSDPVVAGHVMGSGWIAFLSVVLMAICSTTLAASSGDSSPKANPASLDSLVQIEVQSEKLGCLVAQVIQGNVASLGDMKQAIRIIQRETTSLDADRPKGRTAWATQSDWVSLSKDTEFVKNAAGTILRNGNFAVDSKAQLQSSFFALVDMAATLAKTSNDAKRVFHLMNAALVLERMSAKISQFMSNPDEAETTAESLSRDMKFMETTISALLDGNTKIEISAEPDAAMRARLNEARKPMESAFINIRALLAEKKIILELSETSARIAEAAAAFARQARNARIRATD